LATDGSEEATAACRFLQSLPLTEGTTLHLLSVVVDEPGVGSQKYWEAMEQLLRFERQRAEQALSDAAALVKREGLRISPHIGSGNPAREILRLAEEVNADLVVVGSKGLSGLRGFLLGSVARNVARRCERPVLIARAPQHGLAEVLIATDGSEQARHAMQFALRLPLPEGTRATVVHVARAHWVIPDYLYRDEAEHRKIVGELHEQFAAEGQELLAAVKSTLAGTGRPVATELLVGDPVTEILDLAQRRNADLIVAGARGASFLEGLLLGSVADRLMTDARCSVLIVH
jgi:nucleotide-binding universal stress UspA family protein